MLIINPMDNSLANGSWADWCIGNTGLLFGRRYTVRNPASMLTILTEPFRGFPQSLRANAGLLPSNRLPPAPYRYLTTRIRDDIPISVDVM